MSIIRHCPVCGQQNTRALYQPKRSPGLVSKCLHCSMIYIASIEEDHSLIFDGPVTYGDVSPKILTSSSLEDVKDLWEFTFLPNKEAEWPALRENALDALQRIETHIHKPPLERSILDFGSGWGFFLAVAKERQWITFGLEPLTTCSVYARATFGLDIVTNTLREGLLPPNSFDVITSFQVFEHLPYPERDIQILGKALRPDGLILIEVPNIETWTVRLSKARHRHFVEDHINFFSKKTLGRLLEKNGLKVIDRYHPVRRMSVRHLFERWIPSIMPASIAGTFQNLLRKTSLWDRTVGINVNDILGMVACRL